MSDLLESVLLLIERVGLKDSTLSMEDQDRQDIAAALVSMRQIHVDYDLLIRENPNLHIKDPLPELRSKFIREYIKMDETQKEEFRKQVIQSWTLITLAHIASDLAIQNKENTIAS